MTDAIRQQIDSLAPALRVGRRGFVGTAIAGGFAAAVAPVGALHAQVVRTDAEGLDAGPVTIRAAEGASLPAYRAAPAGRTGLPTIVVVQEIFGVHEYIQDVCRRLAKAGWLAIAPELYFRHGDPRTLDSAAAINARIVSRVPDREVLADLDACADWAAGHGGDPAKLGLTGFCWGGRIAWMYAAHDSAQAKRLKAVVAWYGRLQGNATPATPSHPLDVAVQVHAPVLGLYGAQDQGIPLSGVEAMQGRLAVAGPAARASEFVVYPDAGHAFHADYRPTYRRDAADDGWRRALDWFRRHGVA